MTNFRLKIRRHEEDLDEGEQLPPWSDRFIVPGPRVVLFDAKGRPLKRPIGFSVERKDK